MPWPTNMTFFICAGSTFKRVDRTDLTNISSHREFPITCLRASIRFKCLPNMFAMRKISRRSVNGVIRILHVVFAC